MHNDYSFNCRVCGLEFEDKPWGEDGKCPTYEICSCCGVEFGYGDTDPENCKSIREHWIKNENMKWRFEEDKPANWDWEKQKKYIPPDFR